MDTELETFFHNETQENFPLELPYRPEAFDAVSAQLLDQFPDFEPYWDNPNLEQYRDRPLRYFGTAWIENFEGKWVNVPPVDEHTVPWKIGPAVHLPFFPLFHQPHFAILMTLERRDEHIITMIYKHMVEDQTRWITDERPKYRY